jgi:hypothetical protein
MYIKNLIRVFNLISQHAQDVLLAGNILGETSIVADNRTSLKISARRNSQLLSGHKPLDALAAGRGGKRAGVSKRTC